MSNQSTNTALEKQIAAALSDDIAVSDLETLIAETGVAIVDADKGRARKGSRPGCLS
jgi:hypothetical protein